ncbi:hypothetical protein KA017_03765, partial [Candidatus Woesebacteria bacterium]|nr:hypothetical protein [Candidatus Woesebacteria bacterium]
MTSEDLAAQKEAAALAEMQARLANNQGVGINELLTSAGATPAVDTAQPAVDTAQPAVDTAQPAVDTAQPAVDTAQPAVDTAQPAVDTAQ